MYNFLNSKKRALTSYQTFILIKCDCFCIYSDKNNLLISMSQVIPELFTYENDKIINNTTEESFIPHQIFLNHVEIYTSRHIASVIIEKYKENESILIIFNSI